MVSARNVAYFLGVVIILVGAFMATGVVVLEPNVEQIANESWVENPKDVPLAVLTFTFTSKGAFTTNSPIHVHIVVLITKGYEKELPPIQIIFPDAYELPRKFISPSGTPSAGIVNISSTPPYVGDADMEFTKPGSFGYIIYSKELPRYYAANREVIKVSPYEVKSQIIAGWRNLGLGIATIGVMVFLAGFTLKPSRARKKKKDELHPPPPVRISLFQELPQHDGIVQYQFPQVGTHFENRGNSPVGAKVRATVFLDGKDIGRVVGDKKGYYTGKQLMNINPPGWHGNFGLPPICRDSDRLVTVQLNVKLIDEDRREYKMLPYSYSYDRKTNSWYLEPTSGRGLKE